MVKSAYAAFRLPTPLGEVDLRWLDLPDGVSRAVRRQWLRQQVAQILGRQSPARSRACMHWPPSDTQHLSDRACALQAGSVPADAGASSMGPQVWLSWSYMPQHAMLPQQALLAIAPMPVGVDVSAGSLLSLAAWSDVLRVYGGLAHTPATGQDCARIWTGIESADKCLRTGLREWSEQVAVQRAACTLMALPSPHADWAATLAWLPLRV